MHISRPRVEFTQNLSPHFTHAWYSTDTWWIFSDFSAQKYIEISWKTKTSQACVIVHFAKASECIIMTCFNKLILLQKA